MKYFFFFLKRVIVKDSAYSNYGFFFWFFLGFKSSEEV